MPYIDKEKFRMHIIMYQHNPLKVRLTDKEKAKFIRMLDEFPIADVVERKQYDRLLENSAIIADALSKYQSAEEETDNQITVCPMCPDCPDNCPLGADMREDNDNGRFN